MSKYIVISVWTLTIIVLAASTLWLSHPVYGSWWFVALWVIVASMLCVAIVGTRMWRMLPSLMLHASFLLILAGGLATWLFGKSGTIVLSPGQTIAIYAERDGTVHKLSQPITLDSFETQYYPGSMAPRDYVSRLSIGGRQVDLAVNRPVDLGSLRLYQSSFLPDGSSVIGVTDDRPGKSLSFAGYLLFALGGLLTLASRRGRFRSLLRSLGVAVALVAVPQCYAADTTSGDEQVLYNGRVAPVSTPATEFLLKVSGQRSLGGVRAQDVIRSMIAYPELWRDKRFILVKDSQLRDSLGIPGLYASINDIFDQQGNYRLVKWYNPQGTTSFDKALLQLDEKIELILRLHTGEFFKPVPEDMAPLPAWRVGLEELYNRIPFAKVYFMAALTVGILLLLLTIVKVRSPYVANGSKAVVMLLMLWQLTGYVLRWIIYGRIPLGNTGETLVFVSVALLVLGLLIRGKDPLILPMTVELSGFAGLVANLSQSDPIVTPLMPVLSSPWLGIHVTLVMSAYSLLAFSCVVSAIGYRTQRGRDLSLTILYPAVYLLGLGIFTGAVWAEVAWGRYWAWDPKETWALITFMVYAVPLHASVRWLAKPQHYNLYVLLASLTMLMTYFGVNYLGGLHAYS